MWDTNVLDLTSYQLRQIAQTLEDQDMSVTAIASPIGKTSLADPATADLDRCRRAIEAAQLVGAPIIRVFSFYLPEGERAERYREEVIERLGRLANLAEPEGIVLAHENEIGIYGETPERCVELLEGVGSASFRATLDPGNFAECGVRPYDEAYPLLRPYLAYVQVKDAVGGSDQSVLPGEGDGQILAILRALSESQYSGVFSLEPHLEGGGQFGGFSGVDGFREAARAFKALLVDLPVEHG